MSIRVSILITLIFILGLGTPAQAEIDIKLLKRPLKDGRLAFTYIKSPRDRDIYVIDFYSGIISPLVRSPKVDEYPSWSPDGTKLAYYSDESGDREIYKVRWDGTEKTQLTKSKGIDEDPDWSPDGSKIVFHSGRAGGGYSLYSMNADGTEVKRLTTASGKNTVPRWSPRGDEILYSTSANWPGWDIMLLDLGTGNSKQLTKGFTSYCRGYWNPDGSAFVFSYGGGPSVDLYKIVKGKDEAIRLTDRPGREYDAVYADEGKLLFYVAELNKGEENFEIFALNTENNKSEQITSSKGSIRYLSYTPFPTEAQIELE